MDILLWTPFYVYAVSLTARPINLPKFISAVYVASAPTSIIHVREDDTYMFSYECPMPAQTKSNSDPAVNFGRNDLPEPHNEQLDHWNAVKHSKAI